MAAALQDVCDGRTPVLLRIETHAGHEGADQIRSAVETWTDIYAFLFSALGISPSVSDGRDRFVRFPACAELRAPMPAMLDPDLRPPYGHGPSAGLITAD
jgi:hypothetical protein